MRLVKRVYEDMWNPQDASSEPIVVCEEGIMNQVYASALLPFCANADDGSQVERICQ